MSGPHRLQGSHPPLRYAQTTQIVAMLDVLGSTSLLGGTPAMSRRYIRGLTDVYGKVQLNIDEDMSIKTFMDNIALFSEDTGRDVMRRMTMSVAMIRYEALTGCGLLLRGGIVRGGFFHQDGESFVVGQALIDAHELESDAATAR
ncbi:MAG: hypothetical protein WC132_04350 [Methanomethylophilus sp.]